MTVSPETLAAYADGELDAVERERVETAIAADPALGEQLAAHRALAARLDAAYAPVLDEPAPEQLLAAIRGGGAAQVVDLASIRRAKEPPPARKAITADRGGGAWLKWAPMAACLVIGLALGFFSPLRDDGALVGGDMTASPQLTAALDKGLAGEATGPVRIGVSFRSNDGAFCRTFDAADQGIAGLACRQGKAWKVQVAAASASARTSGYRTASSIPPAVAAAVEAAIAGEPLDAAAERAARKTGWR